jgi:hypothetical protein
MKAKDLVQIFTNDYNPDDEIMALWWDSSYSERPAGTWAKAVKIFDEGGISEYDINEQIRDLLNECEGELANETN